MVVPARFALGDRVVSGRTERTATHQAPGGQPRAPACAVEGDRFPGVFRTRGEEPAGRRATFSAPLIAIDGPEQETLHPDTPGDAAGARRGARRSIARESSRNDGSAVASLVTPNR